MPTKLNNPPILIQSSKSQASVEAKPKDQLLFLVVTFR